MSIGSTNIKQELNKVDPKSELLKQSRKLVPRTQFNMYRNELMVDVSLTKNSNFCSSENLQEAKTFYKDYRKIKRLGSGSSSTVKLFCNRKEQYKKLAAKFTKTKNLEIINQQKKEFLAISKLRHPSIIEYSNFYYDPFRCCSIVTMEHSEGTDLGTWAQSRRNSLRIDYFEQEVRQIMSQLLSGVFYLHQNGIVHRDIKPENILVEGNNLVKIIDFNVSKFEENFFTPNLFNSKKQFTAFCMSTDTGTLAYKAPEVLKGECYSETVDIWGCGVVLYFLLAGKAPFEAEL